MHASINLLRDGHIVQHFWCCKPLQMLQICPLPTMPDREWNDSKHVVLPTVIIIRHSVR